MQCALKIMCVFSVIIHQNIDPKSTENPATWTARMHDFGTFICCGQNHRQKKHRSIPKIQIQICSAHA